MIKQLVIIFLAIGMTITVSGQDAVKPFKGQGEIKGVPTETKEIKEQWKGTFSDHDSIVFFSNDFQGGRLNGLTKINDSLYSCLISSENTPVNPSPWYAFKVWAKADKGITIKLTYQNGVKHRYTPKVSMDGIDWKSIEDLTSDYENLKNEYSFHIPVSSDTTWIAAHELITSKHIDEWLSALEINKIAQIDTMGFSHYGNALKVAKVGNVLSDNIIIVMSRQHPPEISGHYAFNAFVETIFEDSELPNRFRNDFLIYVIPHPNPDGVDGGFWRHNAGGVDLNRDWSNFNQPETRAIKEYLERNIKKSQTVYFAVDFHSTYQDIYYTLGPDLKRNTTNLLEKWMDQIKMAMPNYQPNVKATYFGLPAVTSYSYFYEKFNAESLIYEIGDNTPKEFIDQKSRIAAIEMMKLLEKEIR